MLSGVDKSEIVLTHSMPHARKAEAWGNVRELDGVIKGQKPARPASPHLGRVNKSGNGCHVDRLFTDNLMLLCDVFQ